MKGIKSFDFKSGLPREFEIVRLEKLFNQHKNKLTLSHRASFYHILWFKKGHPTHLIDFEPLDIAPDTILFVNRDRVQRFDDKSLFDGVAILFTDNFFCRSEEDTGFLRNSILFNDLFTIAQIRSSTASDNLHEIFRSLESEYKNDQMLYKSELLKNQLHNFLMVAERERRKQGFKEIKKSSDLDYLMRFRDLLEEHFKQQKQVNKYADQMSLPPKRLNQAINKILGKTAKQMIDERILLEAKRILAHTHDSVKEIAFSLGFDEPTNFIKFFRRHSHHTPVEFREKFLREKSII